MEGDSNTANPAAAAAASAAPPTLHTAEEAYALSLGAGLGGGLSWRDPVWLERHQLHVLTVLDYFKQSPFYERTCNNEIARMHQHQQQHDALSLMEGVEYCVDPSSRDDLLLVRKQWRTAPGSGPESTQLLALYCVLAVDNPSDPQRPPRGTVFPLPDLGTVLRSHVSNAMLQLKDAVQELTEGLEVHPAVQGYQWKFEEEKSKASVPAPVTSLSSLSVESTALPIPRHPHANLVEQALHQLRLQVDAVAPFPR